VAGSLTCAPIRTEVMRSPSTSTVASGWTEEVAGLMSVTWEIAINVDEDFSCAPDRQTSDTDGKISNRLKADKRK
jgi:hypothetical protein